MKAIVLNSGGCDSTTCVGIAVKELGAENVMTVSASYGQRHSKELECAEKVAEFYGVQHRVIDMARIFEGSECPLLAEAEDTIDHMSYAEQIERDGEGMVNTYVPFRNGLFLSAAASIAMSVFPKENVIVYIGAHKDDAAGEAYADCSKAFIDAMNLAIQLGTYGLVRIKAPFVAMDKAGVVKTGLEIGVPYELTWSCYEGGEVQCGTCGTCIDRKAAFKANGIKDPVPYKE